MGQGRLYDTVNSRGKFAPPLKIAVTICIFSDGSSNVNLGDSVHNFNTCETQQYLNGLNNMYTERGL